MPSPLLTTSALRRRSAWVEEIVTISGRFGDDSTRIEKELASEIARDGEQALLDHLRLCGSIPEKYSHDSSEEKLYSKYTDALLAAVFRQLGLEAVVLEERADAADVEAFAQNYSLVADAKAFCLSRTAKNQKDFKIEAMHGWKRGKPHAIVVCPIYQLPARVSQIYQQAISHGVCIFSYAHMAVLVGYSRQRDQNAAEGLLLATLRCAESMNPTKDALAYWANLNRTMLDFDKAIGPLWETEKIASVEAIRAAKDEALAFLASERETIVRMTRDEAITQLLRNRNIEGRMKVIQGVADNGILTIA